MPGSVAETVYGRRGGGWAPAKPTAPPVPPKPVADRRCGVCALALSEHTAGECRVCRAALEHHDQGDGDCWAGRARMAAARRSAGVELDDVDREALRRAPPAAA